MKTFQMSYMNSFLPQPLVLSFAICRNMLEAKISVHRRVSMSLASPEVQDVKIRYCRLNLKLQGEKICSNYRKPLDGKSYLTSEA